jgi:hypothetical protein
MTLYCVTDRFPAEEIEVTLNGTRLTHSGSARQWQLDFARDGSVSAEGKAQPFDMNPPLRDSSSLPRPGVEG